MLTLVTSREVQAIDRFATDTLGIPGLALMENAGRGVADAIERTFGSVAGKSVILCCGKGNNGGDGYVAARHLLLRGARVTVAVAGKPADKPADRQAGVKAGEAATNYTILQQMRRALPPADRFPVIESASARRLERLPRADLIVDALLGTGFRGKVREPSKGLIGWINRREEPVVAIDVPSGLSADDGTIAGDLAVNAELTVTMHAGKIGLYTGKGPAVSGRIEVADIGIPALPRGMAGAQTFLLRGDDVEKLLPTRPLDAHKHSVGKIFILAGSRGLTGAAAMAASAALRAGAGTVILGTPASVYPILAGKLTEVMVEPLPETPAGTVSREARRQIEQRLRWADVTVLGPGLSRDPETVLLVQELVAAIRRGRLLLDADALNALASGKSALLRKRAGREIIITPHSGEAGRLLALSPAEIDRDRVAIARSTAREFGLLLVLKGAPTVTATPSGEVYVNSSGNPGMATAGSGDVLTGVIAGLWAQGAAVTAAAAASAGVYLHGLAGDLAVAGFGEKGLLAMDIHDHLPEAFRRVETKGRPDGSV